MDDIDVEKLVENIETTGEANPPEGDASTGGQDSNLNQLMFEGPDALMKHKLEYTANGKQVTEDIETILKRASQGYNYAQLAHELKERTKMVDEQATKATETSDKWSKFESYAKENPKWYDHWTQAWEQRDQLPTGDGVSTQQQDGGFDDSRLTALLEQKLEPIREFITKQQSQAEQLQLREQDQALDQEIKETRAEFPSIDFEKSDAESGKTLQWQVLEFANERGMGFRDAFKVFYHDNLLSSRLEDEKAKWASEQKNQMRNGIMGTGEPPKDGKTMQPDFKSSSWDQVADYAANQLGLNS
jgi:hypothetical protein